MKTKSWIRKLAFWAAIINAILVVFWVVLAKFWDPFIGPSNFQILVALLILLLPFVLSKLENME